MIAFSNVSKQYGRQILFVDASFQINPGEKVGLVGPNGAGKTTLFRMIVGEEAPDEGDVTVPKKLTVGYFRQDVEEMSGPIRARRGHRRQRPPRRSASRARGAPARDVGSGPGRRHGRILSRFGEVQEEYEHLGGYALEGAAREVLHGLGFDDGRSTAMWARCLAGGRCASPWPACCSVIRMCS